MIYIGNSIFPTIVIQLRFEFCMMIQLQFDHCLIFFVTAIDMDISEIGLNEDTVRFISAKKNETTPEYELHYQKLKDIKISIVPQEVKFNRFVDTITNTTGFANENSTQILNRETLQTVRWKIYIQQDSLEQDIFNELYGLLLNHESS